MVQEPVVTRRPVGSPGGPGAARGGVGTGCVSSGKKGQGWGGGDLPPVTCSPPGSPPEEGKDQNIKGVGAGEFGTASLTSLSRNFPTCSLGIKCLLYSVMRTSSCKNCLALPMTYFF